MRIARRAHRRERALNELQVKVIRTIRAICGDEPRFYAARNGRFAEDRDVEGVGFHGFMREQR